MDKNLKTALIIGGIVLAVLVVVPAILGAIWGGGYGGYGMMGPGMMGGFGWGWFMPVLMILFWGLVVWGIVALVRGASSGNTASSGQAESAVEVLKKRYARGEINKEEFEEKKKDLV